MFLSASLSIMLSGRRQNGHFGYCRRTALPKGEFGEQKVWVVRLSLEWVLGMCAVVLWIVGWDGAVVGCGGH